MKTSHLNPSSTSGTSQISVAAAATVAAVANVAAVATVAMGPAVAVGLCTGQLWQLWKLGQHQEFLWYMPRDLIDHTNFIDYN